MLRYGMQIALGLTWKICCLRKCFRRMGSMPINLRPIWEIRSYQVKSCFQDVTFWNGMYTKPELETRQNLYFENIHWMICVLFCVFIVFVFDNNFFSFKQTSILLGTFPISGSLWFSVWIRSAFGQLYTIWQSHFFGNQINNNVNSINLRERKSEKANTRTNVNFHVDGIIKILVITFHTDSFKRTLLFRVVSVSCVNSIQFYQYAT